MFLPRIELVALKRVLTLVSYEKVKNLGGNGTLKFVIVLIFPLEFVICRHLSIYELWKSPVVCVLAAPKEKQRINF